MKKNVPKTQDFGEKIYGAKKDKWKNGITYNDFLEMDIIEANTYIKKNNIWKKPNYDTMIQENGINKYVVYFQKIVRDSLPAKPNFNELVADEKTINKSISTYIQFVQDIKEQVELCKTINECISFYKDKFKPKYVIGQQGRYVSFDQQIEPLISKKFLKTIQMNEYQLVKEVDKKRWGYTNDEKILADYTILEIHKDSEWIEQNQKLLLKIMINPYSARFFYDLSLKDKSDADQLYQKNTWFVTNKNSPYIWRSGFHSKNEAEEFVLENVKVKDDQLTTKKTKTRTKKEIPPQLENIERIGKTIRENNINAKGEHYLKNYCFKGGQFGNWLTEKDRVVSMNMAYDSFFDLSNLLNIDAHDIGLNRNLNIAFGARGYGTASATYSLEYRVINLTKTRGAGSLCHEWIHALDHYIAIKNGYPLTMFSDLIDKNLDVRSNVKILDNYPAFAELIKVMKYGVENPNSNFRTFSKFYKDSLFLDKTKGYDDYYTKPCEMLARASSAYVYLKAKKNELVSDYLLGHAYRQAYVDDKTYKEYYLYPIDKEMEQFGKAFENALIELKEKGILHEPTHDICLTNKIEENNPTNKNIHIYSLVEQQDGQLGFNFGIPFTNDLIAINDMQKLSQSEFLDKYNCYTIDDYIATENELKQVRSRE